MDNSEKYARLKQLIVEMPDLTRGDNILESHQWLAKAHAVAVDPGNVMDTSDHTALLVEIPRIGPGHTQAQYEARYSAAIKIQSILLRRLAALELKVGPSTSGAFIAVGSAYDAFAAVSRVFGEAKIEILIVDPYLDAKVLDVFALGAPESITVRLMADQSDVKASFKPAVETWAKQHGTKRPTEARLSPPKALHDRVIIVDQKRAWSLTQSFNHFAERSPASIVEVGDIAPLKIAAYEAIWSSATVLV